MKIHIEHSSGGSIGGSISIGKIFEAGFDVETTTATSNIYRKRCTNNFTIRYS